MNRTAVILSVHLVAAGGAYTPRFIDAATYEAIVSSPMEKGK